MHNDLAGLIHIVTILLLLFVVDHTQILQAKSHAVAMKILIEGLLFLPQFPLPGLHHHHHHHLIECGNPFTKVHYCYY